MNVLELRNIYIIRLSVFRPCSSLEICVTILFYRVFSETCLFNGYIYIQCVVFLLYETKNGVVVINIISINILIELESSLIQLEISLIQLKSALIQLESSPIELVSALIELQSSPIQLTALKLN